MIAVTAATQFETAWIESQITHLRSVSIGQYTVLEGRLGAKRILIFHTGIGKTNAAHGITLLLEKFKLDLLLLIGCGGAYRKSGLIPGELAIATEEIFGDEGVMTPRGWRSMSYLKLPLLREGRNVFYNRLLLDRKIVSSAEKILKGFRYKTGAFITVSEVTGTDEKADEMEKRFGGICENMEGAAVAQLCILYGIPFLEIRGISNLVKRRNKREWKLSAAARISQEAALEIVTLWKKVP